MKNLFNTKDGIEDKEKMYLVHTIINQVKGGEHLVDSLNVEYRKALHDFDLLKQTKYINDEEYNYLLLKLKDKYVECGLKIN